MLYGERVVRGWEGRRVGGWLTCDIRAVIVAAIAHLIAILCLPVLRDDLAVIRHFEATVVGGTGGSGVLNA